MSAADKDIYVLCCTKIHTGAECKQLSCFLWFHFSSVIMSGQNSWRASVVNPAKCCAIYDYFKLCTFWLLNARVLTETILCDAVFFCRALPI